MAAEKSPRFSDHFQEILMLPKSTMAACGRALIVAFACACGPMIAHAAGFQLSETSGSGLGSAYAGGAGSGIWPGCLTKSTRSRRTSRRSACGVCGPPIGFPMVAIYPRTKMRPR